MSLSNNYPTTAPSLSLDFANTGKLDPRITFSRASTATYYDGVTTAMAEQNLLTYSQDFDNAAWVKTLATVTANSTTAPDGTTSADTINGSAGSAYILEAQNVTNGLVYTFSVYAKVASTNFLQLAGGSSGFSTGVWANFDLSGGTVGTVGASATASIQSVGSGWYRCTITGNATASTSGNMFCLIPVESSTASRFPTNVGATSIYAWGAQFEQRSTVTAYTATTTAPITNYIPVLMTAASNVARFDHTPTTGAALGLLVEEQRTNLLRNSAAIGSTYWSNGRTISFLNSAVAPDGTITATKVAGDPAQTGNKRVFGDSTTVVSSVYTASVYAKAGEITSVKIMFATSTESEYTAATFNLSNGTVTTGANGAITPVGDGWYRCSVFGTATSTASATYIYPIVGGTAGFTGDGYSGVYIWGAQLEAGAFATSYIPTVASTVQRQADSAVMTGTNFSSWYNQSEGTFNANFDFVAAPLGTGNKGVYAAYLSGSSNIVTYASSSTGTFADVVADGGVSQAAFSSVAVLAANTFYKDAFAYKRNDFARSLNAATVQTDTSGTVPNGLTEFRIGRDDTGAPNLNGHIRSIAYYPVRLTNAQLQAITS